MPTLCRFESPLFSECKVRGSLSCPEVISSIGFVTFLVPKLQNLFFRLKVDFVFRQFFALAI